MEYSRKSSEAGVHRGRGRGSETRPDQVGPGGLAKDLDLYLLFYFIFKFLFIYLFMAVLGLRFCARAFSSCGKRGPLFIAVSGPLTIAASLVAERRLSSHGSRA